MVFGSRVFSLIFCLFLSSSACSRRADADISVCWNLNVHVALVLVAQDLEHFEVVVAGARDLEEVAGNFRLPPTTGMRFAIFFEKKNTDRTSSIEHIVKPKIRPALRTSTRIPTRFQNTTLIERWFAPFRAPTSRPRRRSPTCSLRPSVVRRSREGGRA